MCVRLTDRALCLTEFASGETICLKQRAPETALYCASGRSSLQFATGIWRPTERGNAYGFLTTEPNAIVAPIHPKAMPVILHDDDYGRWLTGAWDDVKELVSPYPSQLMRVDQPVD